MFSRRTRIWLSVVSLAHFALLYGLSVARYHNVHQRTFDLALYARVAWGFAHFDLATPVLGLPPLGVHVSPMLWGLGWLGRLGSTVHVLLLAQSACIALCIFPMARMGARHMGRQGIALAVAAWLLYPNLFHVGTYEFHPGTLAVLPMCWAFDALARGHLRHLSYACVGMLACREDLFAMCALFALLFYFDFRKRAALATLAACVVYGLAATGMTLHFAPVGGSLDQHFGAWGGSPLGVVRALFMDPQLVFAHFRAPEKAWYLPRILAALSFFSLRAPRLLIPALPYLALNLISTFPTSTEQYSHYLTPAVPALVISGLVGVTSVRKRPILVLWVLTLALAHYALGGSPLSRDLDRSAYREDAQTRAARQVLAQIPGEVSVQAPDALLPHLTERRVLGRSSLTPGAEYVVIDVSHRERFARREALLRTTEEPPTRALLARHDHALLVYAPPYALLKRGAAARGGPALRKYFVHTSTSASGQPLTSCLRVLDATLVRDVLRVTLRANHACRADLALRLSPDPQHGRADLLFDGALSPALLEPGDTLRSEHMLRGPLLGAAQHGKVWLSTVREDGKTVEPNDPLAVPVLVRNAGAP